MIINIQDDILKLNSLGILGKLLLDKTTNGNIIWATDAYESLGAAFERNKQIEIQLITGRNSNVIKTRARKEMEKQAERTRQHAEVFTPFWVVKKMNDHTDEVWFEKPNVFFDKSGKRKRKVTFPKGKTWQEYVDSRRLEITCGEAPFLVSRYDAESGEMVPVKRRIGILDRKMRIVTDNTHTEEEWLKWAKRALQATYGYEFQGDNVLIARVNLLMTMEEFIQERWDRKPTVSEYISFANVIAWNIWQMDGLKGTIPYCKAPGDSQIDWFSTLDTSDNLKNLNERGTEQPQCRIFDWRGRYPLEYVSLKNKR